MIIFKQQTNLRDRQRGVALLVVTFALLIVTSIAATMIILTNTETSISSNFRDEQLAYFSARAGIEEARDRMRTGATNTLRTASLPTTLPGTNGSVLYILNPANGETVAPWKGSVSTSYPDTEICNETTTITCSSNLPNLSTCSTWCASTTASSVYTATPALAWKWVRVTLKQNNSFTTYATNGNSATASQVCWNGVNEEITSCASPNMPVYIFTALAVTPSGSRRMIQAEIAEDKLQFSAPGALTLDGTGDVMSAANSNGYNVQGSDNGTCGGTAGSSSVPAISVNDAPDQTTIISDIPNGRKNNYTGSGGTTPDVEVGTLPLSLQSPAALQTLVSTIKANVTQPVINGPASNLASPGTSAAPQIIYVNGDLTLHGNVTGYGILVVTGTFTPSGNVGWNGLVLVVGKGQFIGNGGGNNQYNGAVVVANTLDNSGNVLSTLGTPTFDMSGGGGNGVYYSGACISQASNLSTFHDMAIRELLD